MPRSADWTNGVVAILGRDGVPVGAGFVHSAGGLVLTCAHVLEKAGWPYQEWSAPVRLRFKATGRTAQAHVLKDGYHSSIEGDAALLALEKALPDAVKPLPLARSGGTAGHNAYTWGFPAGFGQGLLGENRVLGLVPRDEGQVLQLRSSETTAGYSGGPVWDTAWGRVIGMVGEGTQADARGRLASTSFATPAETLIDLFPNRLTLTPPASQIAEATRDIHGAVQDLVDRYTRRIFVGRDEKIEELDQWLEKNESGRMVVTALAGYGKTALLANWQRRREDQGDFVAAHFFSDRSERQRTVADTYANLLGQLAVYYGLPDETLPEEAARPARLRAMLDDHAPVAGRRLIILLDALDECEAPFQLALPHLLPPGVFLVVSARAGSLDEDDTRPLYLEGWTDEADTLFLDTLPEVALSGWLAASHDGILAAESQDPAFVKALATLSGGYPLYLRYLLDDLAEAKLAGRRPESVLDEPAKGFGDYVSRQVRRLARDLGREEQIQDLFVLLAVARYPLLEDEVSARTELSSFDLVALPSGLTRWLDIPETPAGQRSYALAHGRLAQEFERALRGDAAKKREALLAWCAVWSESDPPCPYPLRHYAARLHQAGQLAQLYELARNPAYALAQQENLPAEPDLPLGVAREALESAAGEDDGPLMAEFLLEHARRVAALRGVSPLEALRSMEGSAGLARAWLLAEVNDAERRLLWLLLLAWELAGEERWDEAEATLARLDWETVPRLSGAEAQLAMGLIRELLPFAAREPLLVAEGTSDQQTPEARSSLSLGRLADVAGKALSDRRITRLVDELFGDGLDNVAMYLGHAFDDPRYEDVVQGRRAIAEAEAGDFEMAMWVINSFRDPWQMALTARRLAIIEAESGDPDRALGTALVVHSVGLRAGTLGRIAETFARLGQHDRAQETFQEALDLAESVEDAFDFCLAQKDIAASMAAAGMPADAGQCFAAALAACQSIEDIEYRDDALRQIALAQAWAGMIDEALTTAATIEDDDWRLDTLHDMATGRSAGGQFGVALKIAQEISDDRDRSRTLSVVAVDQAQSGDFAAARKRIDALTEPGDRVWALCRLATVLAEADEAGASRASLRAAEEALVQIGDPLHKARGQRQIAEALSRIGDADAAAEMLDAAQQTAGQLTRPSRRKQALIEIAWTQARAIDEARARDTIALALTETQAPPAAPDEFEDQVEPAGLLVSARSQVEVLVAIASVQATAGEMAGAQETLTIALEMAGRIPADELDEMMAEIGKVQARSGDLVAAGKTADMVADGWSQAQIIQQIALFQLRSGDLEQAIQVAASLDDKEVAAETYGAIAVAQATRGDEPAAAAAFARALAMAGQMESENQQVTILSQIAADQARAGRGGEATATFAAALDVAGLADEPLRSTAYLRISEAQAAAGRPAAARETAGLVFYNDFKGIALVEAAGAEAEAGDLQAATALVWGLDSTYRRARAYTKIALAAFRQGKAAEAQEALDDALDESNRISDPESHSRALSEIAVAQVRAGQGARAVHTAGLILADRETHLPAVALALGEAGDTRQLSQLLLLCGQDPLSALAACPAIVRLYPEQAAGVVELIVGHRWQ